MKNGFGVKFFDNMGLIHCTNKLSIWDFGGNFVQPLSDFGCSICLIMDRFSVESCRLYVISMYICVICE